MEQYDAVLREWKLVESGNSPGSYSIIGRVYEDKKNRLEESDTIRTSHVNFIDFSLGIAKTRNTTYKLD